MKYLQNFLQFNLEDLQFNGLEFSTKETKSLFWKSEKERAAYVETLIEDGTEYSALRYKNIFRESQKLEIHVKLSLSVLFKTLSFLLMGIAIGASFIGLILISLVLLGISISSFILHNFYRRRSKELYVGFLTGPDLIDFLFAENKREKSETKQN
jgi:hypothetical protein